MARVAIVTGGSRGIGRETAERLASDGPRAQSRRSPWSSPANCAAATSP
ncbi:SDR family NAD(P)-dependent oxidoreductase [Amycolatopsis sp. lyj-112]